MRRVLAIGCGVMLGLCPARAEANSSWGSTVYGDPPGWCTNFSDMWVSTIVTSDPHVGTNPERNTFYGFHANPGYDDWYGYFYGDFRGVPQDASGWVKLLHEDYPDHYHWNFADRGWAVHGHAKEYIAYYNWTFGGQCGLGSYGSGSPSPFMADQFGYPVVDIYVDSVPPYAPEPRVTDMTARSVAFSWDPVDDQGDGAGRDFFKSGLDHYVSWMTLNSSSTRLQLASSANPRTLVESGMAAGDTACAHVIAFDRLRNATAERMACAGPLLPPSMPAWSWRVRVAANPSPIGLVGLESWFWLSPAPTSMTVEETFRGIRYVVTAMPAAADWDFGDGVGVHELGPSAFGQPFPESSQVAHVYEAHDQAGYRVQATVRFDVTWTAVIGGRSIGPYQLGSVSVAAGQLRYPVEQAQPELLAI